MFGKNIAGLCKGSTADSDSVCEGSNPSPAATKALDKSRELFFFYDLENGGFGPHMIPIKAQPFGASRRGFESFSRCHKSFQQ